MAWFVIVVGLTPHEYQSLTVRERSAIINAAKEYHGGQ